jgi:hypothetical protein
MPTRAHGGLARSEVFSSAKLPPYGQARRQAATVCEAQLANRKFVGDPE